MSEFKEKMQKAKDEKARIEFRVDESIKIIESMVWKQKPTPDDIKKLNEVLKLLKGK